MDIETIIVLTLSLLISAVIVLIYRIIKKELPHGIHWIFPISPIIGFVLMYLTSDNDTILLMLKDALIWAFIISMVYVNVKCLVIGSKRTIRSGKGFFTEVKSEWKKMKPSFKKSDLKNKEDVNQKKEGSGDDSAKD